MPPPWSKPLDIARLADAEADVDFEVPLAELERLRAQLGTVLGTVSGRVHFEREAGFVVVDLTLSGTAELVCQRCLGLVAVPVDNTVRVALILTETDASRVPEHLEPVLATGGRISVGELVEEELLLALPIVPLHAQSGECVVAADAPLVRSELPEETTQKPFERLAELFKR